MKKNPIYLTRKTTESTNFSTDQPLTEKRNKNDSLVLSSDKPLILSNGISTYSPKVKLRVHKLIVREKKDNQHKKIILKDTSTSISKEVLSHGANQASFPKIKTTPQLYIKDNHDISLGQSHVVNLEEDNEKNKEMVTEPNQKTYYKIKTYTKNANQIVASGPIATQREEWLEEMKHLKLSNIGLSFNKYPTVKTSFESTNHIKAYAVNSYQGIVRSYNEDRVAIILTIAKPKGYTGTWPKCSFFAVYDGHGGNKCCDFLRDKLQDYIIKNINFPHNPRFALISGIEKAERDFIQTYATSKTEELLDKSGSCALVALIVDNICYVANVGDSRMILSKNQGKEVSAITIDHKPNQVNESSRIVINGGRVYQSHPPIKRVNTNSNQGSDMPFRVFPGGLSVSRTLGDAEAKIKAFGGMPNVVIATPEVTQFTIDQNTDFFMMGCDGIFDLLTNEECAECAWMTMKSRKYSQSLHSKSGAVVDMVIKSALKRRSFDNVTAIFVAFDSYEKEYMRRVKEKEFIANEKEEEVLSENQNKILFTESNRDILMSYPKMKLKLKKAMTVST